MVRLFDRRNSRQLFGTFVIVKAVSSLRQRRLHGVMVRCLRHTGLGKRIGEGKALTDRVIGANSVRLVRLKLLFFVERRCNGRRCLDASLD